MRPAVASPCAAGFDGALRHYSTHATLQHACDIAARMRDTARVRYHCTHATLQHACEVTARMRHRTARNTKPRASSTPHPTHRPCKHSATPPAVEPPCSRPVHPPAPRTPGGRGRTETHTACSQTFAPASVTPTPCMRHDAAQRTSRSGGTQPKVIARHAACACRAFTRPQTTARSMQRTYAIAPFGVRWANRFARFPSHAAFAAGTRVSPNPQQTVDTSRQANQSGVQRAKHPCAQHPARTA
jgi:hypothetical protein